MGVDERQQYPKLREFASVRLPPARRVRHPGSSSRRQHPWEPHLLLQLEGRQWKPVALWRAGLRCQLELERSQRSLEVQSFHKPMDVDGRAHHSWERPFRRRGIRHTRHSCSCQPAGTQVGWCQLDRQERQFLALGWFRARCDHYRWLSQRPVGLSAIFHIARLHCQRHSGQHRCGSDHW